MLAQRHVESDNNPLNKKGVANIIVITLLILLSISAIVILQTSFQKFILQSPIEESCVDLLGFSLENACHLNENEIKVTLKRGSDNINLRKIGLSFLPSDSLWMIKGSKCTDIKIAGRKYGGYCDLPENGETLSYVFNATYPESQTNVIVSITGSRVSCFVDNKEIKASC